MESKMSLPVRERGLKSFKVGDTVIISESLPVRERGLKSRKSSLRTTPAACRSL